MQYRRGEKNKTNKPAGVSVLLCDIFTTDGSACQYHRVGACNYPATRSIKPLTLTSPLDKLINCYLSQTSKGLCYCQRVRSVRSFQGLIHVIFFFLCSFFFLFSCFFFFFCMAAANKVHIYMRTDRAGIKKSLKSPVSQQK